VKVAFTEICKTGNHYEISDASWFPEQDVQRSGPINAAVTLNRKGDSRVEVQGVLTTEVTLVCDRCLAEYGFAVDVRFHLVLEVPAEEHWHVKDIACSTTDLDTVQLLEPVVDLQDVLRQQLYLSLPEKFLCRDHCKGLCATCGVDRNTVGCGCENGRSRSPFAVLAALKKK
jgi:uncharacterized protein